MLTGSLYLILQKILSPILKSPLLVITFKHFILMGLTRTPSNKLSCKSFKIALFPAKSNICFSIFFGMLTSIPFLSISSDCIWYWNTSSFNCFPFEPNKVLLLFPILTCKEILWVKESTNIGSVK